MIKTRHLMRLVMPAVIILITGCQPASVTPASLSTPGQPVPTQQVNVESPTPNLPPLAATQSDPTLDPAELQLQLLYQSSLAYLAETDDQSWQVAKELGYAPLGGYPSNMCGPLAISILKDVGILGSAVDLYDFWLLDPLVDYDLLKTIFPSDDFEWLHTDLPINEIDYQQFPLKAGDMVYIYSGYQGDYSHVLTVTRVDELGRAYSVTNNYTADGFSILEYLLYDPGSPGEGIFYAWPDPANRELGLTGYGGMEIWRPLKLPLYSDGTY
ncbi:hypothetical protein ACFLTX_02425 [Chloroflexota bacterium]